MALAPPCSRRHALKVLAATAAPVCTTGHAQTLEHWPARPVRLIVGFAAGGAADIIARVIGIKMSEMLKQSVVVENKTGASGRIAEAEVAKRPADGYTLLLTPSGLAMGPVLYKSAPYDVARDFQPVARVANIPFAIGIYPRLPPTDLKSFLEYTRSRPAKELNAAIVGPSTRLATAFFTQATKTAFTEVLYRGSAPAAMSVGTNETQIILTDLGSMSAAIASDRVRLLAVTSNERSPRAPAVPTAREQGVDVEFNQWYGVFVRAGTPAPIVTRLNEAFNQAVQSPEVAEKILAIGGTAVASEIDAFSQFYQAELRKWKSVASRARIEPE